MAEVRVISIGGKAPKVKNVGGRKVYYAQGTNVYTNKKGNIQAVGRTVKGTVSEIKEVLIKPETSNIPYTDYEAAAIKATTGGQTTADNQVVYVSAQIADQKTSVSSNDFVERKTRVSNNQAVEAPKSFNTVSADKNTNILTKAKFLSQQIKSKSYSYLAYQGGRIADTSKEVYNYYKPVVLPALAVASIPASAPKAFKTVKSAVKSVTAPAVTTYANVLKSVPKILRVPVNLVASTATTVGITKGVYSAGKASLNPSQRVYLGSKGEQGLAQEAYQAGRINALSGTSGVSGWIDRQVSGIPIADKLVLDKDKFSSGVRSYVENTNLNRSEKENLYSATMKYAKIRRASFASGLISANTFSEVGGQVSFASMPAATYNTGKQAVSGLFKKGFGVIAPQGFIEGTSSVLAEQTASGKGFKTYNYKNVALGGVVGAFGAGAIGGSIVASQGIRGVGGKILSKSLVTSSNVADPFESVGDFIAGTGKTGSSSIVRTPTSISLVSSTTTDTKTSVSTVAQNLAKNRNSISLKEAGSVGTTTKTSTFNKNQVLFSKKARSQTTTFNPTPVGTAVTTNTNIVSEVPIATSTNVNTPAFVNTPATTRTNILTNTRTTTTARTRVTVPTIVVTPNVPFVPLPKGSGRKGFKFPKIDLGKKGYTPSASAALLGIRGKKPSTSSIKTGLGFRPIVSNSKTRGLFARSF